MKNYYFTKDKKFVECEIIEETPHKRMIKFLEGNQAGKTIKIHPEGVSWGGMYPRLFKAEKKPTKFFVHKGRVLVETGNIPDVNSLSAIPEEKHGYRFQPFTTDVIDSIHSKENILLTGGTGVGKTTHITQMANRIGQPLLRINFNGETRMSDLIGKIQVVNGQTLWTDGVLPKAMKEGYWLLLDELDFADPAVLSLLHPVLEDDPMLVLKENGGEIIKPHENFRLFATANSIGAMSDRAASYSGTNTMNEAFLDRWQVLMVDNLAAREEIRVLRDEAPGLKPKWIKQIVEFANKARAKDENGDSVIEYTGDNFSTRKTISWAKKASLHRCPIKGAKLSWLDKMPLSEQDVMLQTLNTIFGQTRKSKKTKIGIVVKNNTNSLSSLTGAKRGRPRKNII